MDDLSVRGIGLWTPGVADWTQARALIGGDGVWPEAGGARPIPSLMPANERRRAPDSVLLALAVAEQACVAAEADPATLPSVFVSVYGDLAINDYMCATLADEPAMLSPTKFHNSVHNAPSGYWSIATGAMTPTTSVAGWRESFAAGLLETAMQIAESGQAHLLVAYDVAAVGPMAEVAGCSVPFGCALLLDPNPRADSPRLRLRVVAGNATPVRADDPGLAALSARNPIAEGAGALLQGLAVGASRRLVLPLAPGLDLAAQVDPQRP